ncbi:hypothetical protein [Desulfovulcanus sp.]
MVKIWEWAEEYGIKWVKSMTWPGSSRPVWKKFFRCLLEIGNWVEKIYARVKMPTHLIWLTEK